MGEVIGFFLAPAEHLCRMQQSSGLCFFLADPESNKWILKHSCRMPEYLFRTLCATIETYFGLMQCPIHKQPSPDPASRAGSRQTIRQRFILLAIQARTRALRTGKEWWRSMPKHCAQRSDARIQFTYAQHTEDIELSEIEREIHENRDQPLSSVLKGVIERVRSLTDAEGAFLVVCDAWGVVCRASAGKAPDVGSKLPSEPTLTRRCMESGQVVTFYEYEEEDFRIAPPRWRSIAVVPVQGQGSVLGVLEVLSSRTAAFSPQHVAALQHIAHLLAPNFQPEEPEPPKARRGTTRIWTTVSGAALLLVSLWLWFEFYGRPRNRPPATNTASNPAAMPNNTGSMAMPTDQLQSPEIFDHSQVGAPAPAPLSSSPPLVQPGAPPSAALPSLKPSPEIPLTTGRTTSRRNPSQRNPRP